jgi:hypothetical protein
MPLNFSFFPALCTLIGRHYFPIFHCVLEKPMGTMPVNMILLVADFYLAAGFFSAGTLVILFSGPFSSGPPRISQPIRSIIRL